MSTIRRAALGLLPKRGTTGIGSLPHTQLELGLQMALQVDIPYLPQLPVGNPSELMIPAALEGLPGVEWDAEGLCSVDLAKWREGKDAFGARLEAAIRSGALEAFEPSAQACRAWQPFLWEVEHRKLALAKIQLAGPCTVRWVSRLTDGAPIASVPELEQQIFRLVLARALAMARAIRRANATPLFFFDEPGLYALDVRDPGHLIALQELKLATTALRNEGALVGLHCCGNTTWSALLGLEVDLLSIDVRLSLDALVEEREAFLTYLREGGALSLGIVPTNLEARYDLRELAESCEATLRAVLPRGTSLSDVLDRCLLTPACGLAMRKVTEAEQVFADLKEAQRQLARIAA